MCETGEYATDLAALFGGGAVAGGPTDPSSAAHQLGQRASNLVLRCVRL